MLLNTLNSYLMDLSIHIPVLFQQYLIKDLSMNKVSPYFEIKPVIVLIECYNENR